MMGETHKVIISLQIRYRVNKNRACILDIIFFLKARQLQLPEAEAISKGLAPYIRIESESRSSRSRPSDIYHVSVTYL